MRRSGPLRRRTALGGRSDRGQTYHTEYMAASHQVHHRSGGRCEIRAVHQCLGHATEFPHHRKLRSQGGSNSLVNLLDCCANGHYWIHRVLPRAEAERLQLLIPRETPEYPYRP